MCTYHQLGNHLIGLNVSVEFYMKTLNFQYPYLLQSGFLVDLGSTFIDTKVRNTINK